MFWGDATAHSLSLVEVDIPVTRRGVNQSAKRFAIVCLMTDEGQYFSAELWIVLELVLPFLERCLRKLRRKQGCKRTKWVGNGVSTPLKQPGKRKKNSKNTHLGRQSLELGCWVLHSWRM